MNNNAILLYHSKTGFTKRYAEWIAQALSCDLVPYKKRAAVSLADYGIILFGGGFHAGMIKGIKWLKEQLPSLANKKICIFVTGATPAESPDVQKALRQNFTEEEWKTVRVFYLQSGLCYEKMGGLDKLLMAMFRAMMKKQEGENSVAYQTILRSFDNTSKEAILPVVEYCQS